MRIGNKQPRHEILVPRFHAGAPLAAAPLRPIDGQRHPLDIAAVAYGDDHVFLLDQVFVILVDKLVGNLGTAVIRQPVARRRQLFKHHLVDTRG